MGDEKLNIETDDKVQFVLAEPRKQWRLKIEPPPVNKTGWNGLLLLQYWCHHLCFVLNQFDLRFYGTEEEFEEKFGRKFDWFEEVDG